MPDKPSMFAPAHLRDQSNGANTSSERQSQPHRNESQSTAPTSPAAPAPRQQAASQAREMSSSHEETIGDASATPFIPSPSLDPSEPSSNTSGTAMGKEEVSKGSTASQNKPSQAHGSQESHGAGRRKGRHQGKGNKGKGGIEQSPWEKRKELPSEPGYQNQHFRPSFQQEQGIAHKDSGDGEKNILSRPEFDSFARWTEQSIRDLKDESKRLANATEYVSRDEFERFAQWTKESIRSLQEDNQRLRAKLEHRANVETTKVSPPMPVPSPSPTEARLVVAGGRRRSSPGITASAVALSCRSKHPSVCLPDLSEPACCGSLAYDGTTLLTLGGGSFRGGVASRKAEALLQESSKSWHWREIASMPSRRMAGCAHALAGGDVIACGGCDGDPSSAMSACDRLDVERNAWRESAPMLSNRAFAGSALASGALHLVGGFDGKRYLASCERFDPREGKWQALPPLAKPRSAHAVVCKGEGIYAFGGLGGKSSFNTDAEVRIEPLSHGFQSVSRNDRLVRGLRAQVFDIRGGRWQPLGGESAPGVKPRCYGVAADFGWEGIVLSGGFDDAGEFASPEFFSISRMQIESPPECVLENEDLFRAFASACVVDGEYFSA